MGRGVGKPLGVEQLHRFAQDGYVVVPGLVPDEEIDRALEHIEALAREEPPVLAYGSREVRLPPERTDHPGVARLLHDTPLLASAEALVGQPLQMWGLPQIALRLPEQDASESGHAPHIDGVPVEGTGLDLGTNRLQGFTVLAGVLLTTQPADPPSGNLMVWPGSHLRVSRWLADHGPEVADPDQFLHRHIPAIAAEGKHPLRIGGHRGDAVFAHYLLIHAAGVNLASQPRYAAFFRLEARARDGSDDSVYTDPWKEWGTIRRAAAR